MDKRNRQLVLHVRLRCGSLSITTPVSLLANEFDLRSVLYGQVSLTGVYLLDFFCSGIQFYLLLSPYLCFISFLYLDLYVLGDDALIS